MVVTRMTRRHLFAALGASASASLLVAPAAADAAPTDDVALTDVPAKVRKAADAAVPGARWSDASREEEDGEVLYELEGKDARKRPVTIEITAAGTVTEIETEIPLQEVPELVKSALRAKMPRFKVASAYEVREEGKVSGYSFDGKRPRDKEEISVYVSKDGKEIEKDDD